MADKKWAGTTFGNDFMHQSLISMLRHTDVRLWYAFTAVAVIPPCMIFAHGSRTAFRYFRHQQGYNPLRAFFATYRNLLLFAEVVIDRFAMFAGKKMKLSVEGYDDFKKLAAGDDGFVILSAHIGCYEMGGYELTSDKKMFNALVYAGEKADVMEGRQRLFSSHNIRMIPIRKDMSHLFSIASALSNKEIVSLPADRVFGSKRTVGVSILGSKAELPEGPFSVAAMHGVNVLAINVMKTSTTGYTAYVTPLHYDRSATRREQVKQLADGYAAELTKRLRQKPCQWYNYFNFWTDD